MENWRPQHYQATGRKNGIAPDVLDAAMQTANAILRVNPRLQPVLTLRHLADLTDCDYGYLRSIIGRSIENPYRLFTIHKRPGPSGNARFRTICVPDPQLLRVQRWLATNVLNHSTSVVHYASKAFAPGCTLVRAAEPHCGSRWLVKVDVSLRDCGLQCFAEPRIPSPSCVRNGETMHSTGPQNAATQSCTVVTQKSRGRIPDHQIQPL